MVKKYWKTSMHVLLLLLAALLLFTICRQSDPLSATVEKCRFLGEYSQNGGAWMPLEGTSMISSLDGDLILRGHFDRDIPLGTPIDFYLNHITYDIDIDQGPAIRDDGPDQQPPVTACARYWHRFTSPGIGEEDIVEIRLHNPHGFGNKTAYMDFLNKIYLCTRTELRAALFQETVLALCAGTAILVISLGLIGIAIIFSVIQEPVSLQLWPRALLSFFVGGYVLLDTTNASLWSPSITFDTYAQHICIMLAVLEIGVFLAVYLSSGARRGARVVAYIEGAFLAGIFVLCLTGQVHIFDTLFCWAAAQMLFCPALMVCCIYEWRKAEKRNPVVLLLCVLSLAAVVLDLLNLSTLWWPEGTVVKLSFVLFFVLQLVSGIRNLPVYYQKSIRASRLVNDLENTNIVMAMSRIKMHFVFNVLNAISGMCKYDPEKADETVVCFARYLRANIDIAQKDPVIPFAEELRCLEDYIELERIRFGDRIQFISDIAEDDFEIPPLTLQPIVENSIKHGLTPKMSGGTVFLRTWREGKTVWIVVEDDGVGFSPEKLKNKYSIGIKNVRFRLDHLMGGTLTIKSVPDRGTTATISIPYKEAEACE